MQLAVIDIGNCIQMFSNSSCQLSGTSKDAIFEYAVNGLKAILPGNFFTFSIRPA